MKTSFWLTAMFWTVVIAIQFIIVMCCTIGIIHCIDTGDEYIATAYVIISDNWLIINSSILLVSVIGMYLCSNKLLYHRYAVDVETNEKLVAIYKQTIDLRYPLIVVVMWLIPCLTALRFESMWPLLGWVGSIVMSIPVTSQKSKEKDFKGI